MVKNLVFDIGNVLLKFDREKIARKFYNGDNFDFFKKTIFDGWEKQDSGDITCEDYKKKVVDALPFSMKKSGADFCDRWEDEMEETPLMREFLHRAKKMGYKLYIISNMTEHFIERDGKFEILKPFDGIVYSAPIKMIKPDIKIYEYLLSKYSLKGEECVFIDDLRINLDAAEKVGMKTFLFKGDTAELEKYINSL